MSDTITYTGQLRVESCPVCGVMHAIPEGLQLQARRHGAGVYCPLGHRWVYMKSLETELAEARNDARWYQKRLGEERQWHQHTTNILRGTKAALTRTKRRVAAGVCPCCHRSFQSLREHMKRQHPDYLATEE